MKVKFQKIERIAGIFIVVAMVGAASLTVLAAIKKGWFQAKVEFKTKVLSADGLRPGSQVTISGIRAGEITDVELIAADNIIVHFNISEKFHKQIRKDSKVYIVRPFVIGDKAIELTVGSNEEEVVQNGAMLESEMSFDMLELVSGKKLGPFLGTVEGLMQNVSVLAQAFADPKRTQAFVKMFDRMDPLFMNLDKMSIEVTRLTKEMNQIMPQ
ncbi:MAG: MCE family protein, partial [Bdellovibrionales bacterium]|nr:MCE family protein [Bdellovibrionales bacterium]